MIGYFELALERLPQLHHLLLDCIHPDYQIVLWTVLE